jgi:hypothetical protein
VSIKPSIIERALSCFQVEPLHQEEIADLRNAEALEARARLLEVSVERLRGLRRCELCESQAHIDVRFSLRFGTFQITCLSDGWTTLPTTSFEDAASDWNRRQREIVKAKARHYRPIGGA